MNEGRVFSNVCVFSLSPCACVIYTFTTHSVVVYIAGGATYEEATKVAELNASGGIQVVLGGSYAQLGDVPGGYGRRVRAGRGVIIFF